MYDSFVLSKVSDSLERVSNSFWVIMMSYEPDAKLCRQNNGQTIRTVPMDTINL